MPDSGNAGTSPLYDRTKVDKAIEQFRALDLNLIEGTLASFELMRENLKQFRAQVQSIRREKGDGPVADFARYELNDMISDLQDAIAPTVRTYNALLRDPDDKDQIPG